MACRRSPSRSAASAPSSRARPAAIGFRLLDGDLLEQPPGRREVLVHQVRERPAMLGVPALGPLRVGLQVLVEACRGLAPLAMQEGEVGDEVLRLIAPVRAGVTLREEREPVHGLVVRVGAGQRPRRVELVLEPVGPAQRRALVEGVRGLERATARAIEDLPALPELHDARDLRRRRPGDPVERPQGVVRTAGVREGLGPDEQLLAEQRVRRREALQRDVRLLAPGRVWRVDADPPRVPHGERRRLGARRQPELARTRVCLLEAGLLQEADHALADCACADEVVGLLVRVGREEQGRGIRVRAEVLAGLLVGARDEPRLGEVERDVAREQGGSPRAPRGEGRRSRRRSAREPRARA